MILLATRATRATRAATDQPFFALFAGQWEGLKWLVSRMPEEVSLRKVVGDTEYRLTHRAGVDGDFIVNIEDKNDKLRSGKAPARASSGLLAMHALVFNGREMHVAAKS